MTENLSNNNVIQVYLNETLVEVICASEDIMIKLLNDDIFLIEYIAQEVKEGNIPFLTEEDLPTMSISRPCYYDGDDEDNAKKENNNNNEKLSLYEVWNHKGKPSVADTEATTIMLQLRASHYYKQKFDDKQTNKLSLWQEIAEKLKEYGYLTNNINCRQKFSNVQKRYIKFKRHVHTTGNEKKIPPDNYDLLHSIFGEKDKVTLQYITDTLPMTDESTKEVEEETQLEKRPSIVTTIDSKSEPKSNKPCIKKPEKVRKIDIYKEIAKMGEKNEIQFNTMCKLMETQNNQREKIIDVLSKIVADNCAPKASKKKRRRSSTSSE